MNLIEKHRRSITRLCKKYFVQKLYVFGSYAKKTMHASSDVDMLVYFKKELPLIDYADNFFDLKYAIEKVLNKNVDLVSGKPLSNPYFIEDINKTKLLVYDAENQEIYS
jgi:predicted nucleotidyltransferase